MDGFYSTTFGNSPAAAGIVTEGRLGVGTTAPTEALDVRGNATVSGSLTVGSTVILLNYTSSGGGNLRVNSSGHLSLSTSHSEDFADTNIDNYNDTYYLVVEPGSGSTWSSNLRLYNVGIRCRITD